MSAPPAVEPEETPPRMEEIRKVNTGVDPSSSRRGNTIHYMIKILEREIGRDGEREMC